MAWEDFEFAPEDGLENATNFPSKPTSGAAARTQFMTILNQIKAFFNGTVKNTIDEHKAENVQDAGGVHGLEIEEGTWTPSPVGATFDVVYATYTKIGNLIKLQCQVNVTVKGTSFVIRGLPFIGVSKNSYGTYINHAEPLETQQTYYARIDNAAGSDRLGIFYSDASGAITTLIPSVGTFSIDIIYNID